MAKPLTIQEIDALPIGAADKARLKAHYGYDAGEQSRPAAAYDGAKIAPWGAARGDALSGKVQPVGGPVKYQATNIVTGKPIIGTPAQLQTAAAKGYVAQEQADGAWAEATGGAVAGKTPKETPLGYSATVPKVGGGTTTLYLSSGKPEEVEQLVKNGTISRETADKIYAARNAGDPMQTMVAKTPPKPGMDYAPKATAVDPSAYDAPLPAGKPLTSPALPGAPKPIIKEPTLEDAIGPIPGTYATEGGQPMESGMSIKPGTAAKVLDAVDPETWADAADSGVDAAKAWAKKKMGKK